MHFAPFFETHPHLAAKETRALTVTDESLLTIPPGTYGLVEFYCADPKCDCRRVMLHIFPERENRCLAVINYGWESYKFYEKWLRMKDRKTILELRGPCLNATSPQSPYASEFLKIVRDLVLKDRDYINRIKRHYDLVKGR